MLRSQAGIVIWLLIRLPIVNGTLHEVFCANVKILLIEHKIAVRNPLDRFRKRKSRGGQRRNLNRIALGYAAPKKAFQEWLKMRARGSKIGYQSAPSVEVRQSTLYQILHRMNGLSLRLEPAHEQVKFDVTEERRYSCPRKRLMGRSLRMCVLALSSRRKDWRGLG